MNKRPILLITFAILLAVAGWLLLRDVPANSNGSSLEEGEASTYNLHVQQRGSDRYWRVWDAGGTNRGNLRVARSSSINWRAHRSDMLFTFEGDVDDYFTYEAGTFSGDSARVSDNDWLRVTLRDDAPRDTLVYQVFVVNADTFAVGNSPPVLIVY